MHLDFRRLSLACSLLLVLTVDHAACANVYDEDVDGDISGEYHSPTPFALAPGVNTLYAYTGSTDFDDLEYLRVDVPAGHQLSGVLMQYFAGPDLTAFIGLQGGTAFTFPAGDAFSNIDNMLGWAHFGPDAGQMVGDDLLPVMGANGQTFTGPLTGSNYTFWIQQTGSSFYYQLDFVVEVAVPEPGTWLLAATVGLFVIAHRRRIAG